MRTICIACSLLGGAICFHVWGWDWLARPSAILGLLIILLAFWLARETSKPPELQERQLPDPVFVKNSCPTERWIIGLAIVVLVLFLIAVRLTFF